MSKIDELIGKYESLSVSEEEADVFIKVKLRMIRSLFEDVKGSEDRIYMEEIISKFAEIMDRQQEIIGSLLTEVAAQEGYSSTELNYFPSPPAGSDPEGELSAPGDPAVPSFLPPEGGFQQDEEVKKAFINYLTYHVNRKTKAGKDRPFSVHTIYDYSSRIKVLMKTVYEEWKEGGQDSWIQLDEQALLADCPFLNAYHNISVLRQYVERKEQELCEISMGLREPVPENKRTPLDHSRNLNNTNAALTRFEEFRRKIEDR